MATDTSGRYRFDLAKWSLNGTRMHRDFLDSARAEHILIEADTDEDEIALAQPRVPQKRFVLENRAHALETELTLFEGGWLSVRERRRNKPGEARLLYLRYLDRDPCVSRYVAKRTLYLTLALFAAALTAGGLAGFSVLPTLTVPATAVLLIATGAAFAASVYRTQKRVVYLTLHGRAPVLRLLGTLGSFRALRKIVPELTQAIDESKRPRKRERVDELRGEMREHYRLRESGIIDQQTCSDGTQRILGHF